MPNRAQDWFLQAEHDWQHARRARVAGDHDWACFAAQQAAEKAVKALHQAHGQEAWGHSVLRLLEALPVPRAGSPDRGPCRNAARDGSRRRSLGRVLDVLGEPSACFGLCDCRIGCKLASWLHEPRWR